jgi:hypothetical protein
MTTDRSATHRVHWQVWTGFVEHGAHASGYGKRKRPKPQSRDFSSESAAREFIGQLRARYGGPDNCVVHLEALTRKPEPVTPSLPNAESFPWRAGRPVS